MPAVRNRYADFLRVVAIVLVVLGHWLVTSISYRAGRFTGQEVLGSLPWTAWLTLIFQVMPIFFLVGGFANSSSWTTRGENWEAWVRRRTSRLLWPTTVYVVAVGLAVIGAHAAGVRPGLLEQAAWAVAFHLWFLPVYLVLIALTPFMYAAHRRWGLTVPVVMAGCACAVDAAVIAVHPPLLGWANYLLVWGAIHQLGFAWQDGRLTRRHSLPIGLAIGGALTAAGLIWLGPYPVSMVGVPGARIENPSPPSVALLAYCVAQVGLVLIFEPVVARWLERGGRWNRVRWANARVMTVYLWHMIPVVAVALVVYPTGLIAEPRVGSGPWWELRIPWLVALAAILALLVVPLGRIERPLSRLDARPRRRSGWGSFWLVVGAGTAAVCLSRLSIEGFDPGAMVPAATLVAYLAGVALVLWPSAHASTRVLSVQTPSGRFSPHPTL